jgi:D-3-phosphoglycerate dehydrogenase
MDESAFPAVEPYLDLADTAGTIAVQLFDGHVSTVEVSYAGDIADYDTEIVTATALKGVFQRAVEMQVNAVNAERIAEERGIGVTESKTSSAADFQSLITVTVSDGEDEISVSGTQFAGDDARIVRIDGYRVDAVPHGHMLVARNEDAPGVIGFVGTVLGDADVNIAGMFNGRETIGGEALTVYNLDDPVPDETLGRLHDDGRVIETTYISLDSGD